MMVNNTGPHEGKIVVLEYTEADCSDESTACLVYRVENGTLRALYGVLDLPQEVGGWHTHSFDQFEQAIQVIKASGTTEVYTPYCTSSFLGQTLGYFNISEQPNEEDEIECWGELKGVHFAEIENSLIKAGITMHCVENERFECIT